MRQRQVEGMEEGASRYAKGDSLEVEHERVYIEKDWRNLIHMISNIK
jgi:hypothetical protein